MDEPQLRALYDEERTKEQVELGIEATEKDQWARHNDEDAKTISEIWRLRSRWTVEQAVALSLGREPSIVDSRMLREPLNRWRSPFARAYTNLLEDASLAVKASELEDPIDPSKFISWVHERDIDFPAAAIPPDRGDSRDELQAKLNELEAENAKLNNR